MLLCFFVVFELCNCGHHTCVVVTCIGGWLQRTFPMASHLLARTKPRAGTTVLQIFTVQLSNFMMDLVSFKQSFSNK